MLPEKDHAIDLLRIEERAVSATLASLDEGLASARGRVELLERDRQDEAEKLKSLRRAISLASEDDKKSPPAQTEETHTDPAPDAGSAYQFPLVEAAERLAADMDAQHAAYFIAPGTVEPDLHPQHDGCGYFGGMAGGSMADAGTVQSDIAAKFDAYMAVQPAGPTVNEFVLEQGDIPADEHDARSV